MPPDRNNLRFFFDESALGVGKALAIVRRDVIHAGHPLIEGEIPLGTLDPQWMPIVAERRLVVIARDRRVRTKPAELRALQQHSLRVFWIAGKREASSWEKLVRLVHRWGDVERVIRDRGVGPWFMAIREHDVVDVPLPATNESPAVSA